MRAGVSASRRDFLKSGGALIVSFSSLAACADDLAFAQGPFATQDQRVARQLDSWLAIGADGRVTAYTGKCELGQGIFTVQMQLVAEELSVPLSRVTLIQCDTSVSPDQGTTSGSQSTPTNFNEANLAQACATAREALLRLAAGRLAVPVEQLTVVDGVVGVQGDASRWVGYGELVGGKKFNLTLNPEAKRKPANQWTILGKPAGRVDMASMATGQFEFVHNVRLPGMLHGRVVRPPAVGATLVGVDEGSVRSLPGVVKVVVRKNFVGVVAEKPWQAIQAAEKLEGHLDPRDRTAGPCRLLRAVAEPTIPGLAAREFEGRGPAPCAGGAGAESDLPASVPDARVDGQFLRRRRRESREGDHLVADAVGLSDPQRVGAAARPAAGGCTGDLHARIRLLRDQRCGHRVVRRGAAVAGGRETGARAAVAQGRDGVGELRHGLRGRSARRHRRLGHDRRLGLRRVVGVARRPSRATTGPAT